MGWMLTFLNSNFGLVLATAVLGAIGLFTWQRQDWVYKERYLRAQVVLDRQLDLIERINKDVGKLVALAASTSSPILKGPVPDDETTGSINTYNDFQSSWFGSYEAYQALLAYYFPTEIPDSFARVVEMTGTLDMVLTDVRSRAGAEKAFQAGLAVTESLSAWNAKVMKQFKSGRTGRGKGTL